MEQLRKVSIQDFLAGTEIRFESIHKPIYYRCLFKINGKKRRAKICFERGIDMIDKEVFRKTESRLYRHFKQAKLIEKLKHKVVIMWKQMEQIGRDIRETNVTVETGLNMGIDYSSERIQTSPSGSSYAEQQIILEIGKLERELLYKKKKMLKLTARIRELEEQMQDMQYNLSTLSEGAKRFIEWKYEEEKSVDWIGNKMYGGARATAYRKREELVGNIAQWCNFKN